MATIQLPPEFFRRERDTIYSNWQFAFWRELFQNSTEPMVMATEIAITMEQDGNGTVISFADDGIGMDDRIINDVYFSLGRSGKDGTDSVGGFGRARILTCFAMDWYRIRTQNWEVEGQGATYDAVRTDDWYQGTALTIKVDEEMGAMRRELESYLASSCLTQEVSVNGDYWDFQDAKGEHVRDLACGGETFARVHVNNAVDDSNLAGYITVRINGTMMYHKCTSYAKGVILEIVPEVSREVLTASRDDMKYKYGHVLSKFMEELSVNRQSAMKSHKHRAKLITGGRGMAQSTRASIEQKETVKKNAGVAGGGTPGRGGMPIAGVNIIGGEVYAGDGCRLPGGGAETRLVGNVRAVRATAGQVAEMQRAFDDRIDDVGRQDDWSPLPATMVYTNTANEELLAAAKKWRPGAWQWERQGDTVRWKVGANYYRILEAWRLCVEQATDSLVATGLRNDITWSIGWVFDELSEAMRIGEDVGNFFLLNPVTIEGKPRYTTRDRKSIKRMMALAKHEVAHVYESWHDESFANAMTEIDAHYDEWTTWERILKIRA